MPGGAQVGMEDRADVVQLLDVEQRSQLLGPEISRTSRFDSGLSSNARSCAGVAGTCMRWRSGALDKRRSRFDALSS